MECYYEKDDEKTSVIDDMAIVCAGYPEADVIFGRTIIGGVLGYGVYESGNNHEGPRLDLLGIGKTVEHAWYSAAIVVQKLMVRRLEE